MTPTLVTPLIILAKNSSTNILDLIHFISWNKKLENWQKNDD